MCVWVFSHSGFFKFCVLICYIWYWSDLASSWIAQSSVIQVRTIRNGCVEAYYDCCRRSKQWDIQSCRDSVPSWRLSYLLQLVSGGGDRYTEPYGQLSMWDCRLRKYSWRLTVLADSVPSSLRILKTPGGTIKSTARVVSQVKHVIKGTFLLYQTLSQTSWSHRNICIIHKPHVGACVATAKTINDE